MPRNKPSLNVFNDELHCRLCRHCGAYFICHCNEPWGCQTALGVCDPCDNEQADFIEEVLLPSHVDGRLSIPTPSQSNDKWVN